MKPERFTAGVFMILVMGMMIAAFYSLASNKVFNPKTIDETAELVIDLEQLYPFPDGAEKPAYLKEPGRIARLYDYLKNKLEVYTSENLPGYYSIVETAKKYEDIIGWDLASLFDYNAVIPLKDGYFSSYVMSLDVSPDVENVKDFADFCAEKGIQFFYINFPTKICISEDSNISGILDFANQNTDRFLAMLKESGVKYYDFRTRLHESGRGHHEAFFRTDHHWKPETGLWAAGEVLKILRDDFGWDVEPGIIAPENFEYVIYRDWFLGSQGRKVTLSRTTPEDFTMIYPKFETSFRFEIPSLLLDVSGDFGITYCMSDVETMDYYDKNPYGAYIYGDRPLVRFSNVLAGNDKKLLIFHDSFGNSVVPFVALGVRELYSIDLRHFTGSVRSFIDKEKPDAVIAMYPSSAPGNPIEPLKIVGVFDFR